MALITKKDKDQNQKKPADREEAGLSKKQPAKKVVLKNDRKPVVVKKDTVNRFEKTRAYLRGVNSELKKVHWPTRREVAVYTVVVVIAVIIVAILIWLFDSLMSRVLQLIIG